MTTRGMNALVSIFVILPGALLGGAMAGDFYYNYDHAVVERTHHSNPQYMTQLNTYEWTGAALGALPGAVLLWVYRRRHSNRAATTTGDAT